MTHARMDTLLQQASPGIGGGAHGIESLLFARARERARRGQFWATLSGRSQSLLALSQVSEACDIDDQIDGGNRPVPIRCIRGSAGRSKYFDSEFNPLYDRARGRWLNIARARQQGKNLPPVSLVRVGDIYFVMDGHHRISVARALGQSDIEARITILQVTGTLPWEMPQVETGPKRAFGGLRRRAVHLQRQAALHLQAVLVLVKGGERAGRIARDAPEPGRYPL